LRICGNHRLDADRRRQLVEFREHIAAAAQLDDLADDLPPVHRVQRPIVHLDEYADRRAIAVSVPQLLNVALVVRRGALGDIARATTRLTVAAEAVCRTLDTARQRLQAR
jgi:hypothetical protein